MTVTFPKIDSTVPTSVLRSRYKRHAIRAAAAWQGAREQLESGEYGATGRAYRLAVMAQESRDYAELLRQELRRRRVNV